ncbi:MAG TPA: ornithine cyclodeaminase family protein [Solirubrobacteraceae bacterium]|nr:ornithine cyclodeaminase family protein [Solirubrobacteraceae bacterium]
MLVLSHDDVVAALKPEACADAMAEILIAQARGQAYFPLRSVVAPPKAEGFIGLMPAWRGGHDATFALKALCVMPGNPARGLDSHQGVVILSDPHTGIPTAILDASAITAIRTAAVTAVATRTLARSDARVLAILGSGVQGKAHVTALGREFEEVRVYSPSTGGSAEEAVRGADVVVTATSSREPVLKREWLAPGTHVNAVGASMPSARELDTATVADAALFCDSRESLRNEAGEFRLAIEQGAIAGEAHVRGELGEVLADKVDGRRDDHELTVFRSLGLAIEDLAAAQLAVARAQAKGIGTEVEL